MRERVLVGVKWMGRRLTEKRRTVGRDQEGHLHWIGENRLDAFQVHATDEGVHAQEHVAQLLQVEIHHSESSTSSPSPLKVCSL